MLGHSIEVSRRQLILAASSLPAATQANAFSSENSAAASFLPQAGRNPTLEEFGGRADAVAFRTATIGFGQRTLIVQEARFEQGDAGKFVSVAGAGANKLALVARIETVQSATTVSLSEAAASSVSNARGWYGTDNSEFWAQARESACERSCSIQLAPGSYAFTGSLDARSSPPGSRNFPGVAGCGMFATTLVSLTPRVKALLVGSQDAFSSDQYQRFSDFRIVNAVYDPIEYDLGGDPTTSSAGLYFSGLVSFSDFNRMILEGFALGSDSNGQGAFSCRFGTIRYLNNWCSNRLAFSEGSGYVIDNIYVSNPNITRADRGFEVRGCAVGFASLINVEHSNLRYSALKISSSRMVQLANVTIEGIRRLGGEDWLGDIECASAAPTIGSLQIIYTGYGARIEKISAVGNTVTAVLNTEGTGSGDFEAMKYGGSGLLPGEIISIDGFNEAGFNGQFTVSEAGIKNGQPWVRFQNRARAPANGTPRQDFGTLSKGSNPQAKYALAYLSKGCELLTIETFSSRTPYLWGHSAEARADMTRLAKLTTDSTGKLKIEYQIQHGHVSVSSRDNPIVGYQILDNIEVIYFQWPHGLMPGSEFKLEGAAAGLDAADDVKTVLQVIDNYTVSCGSLDERPQTGFTAADGAYAIASTARTRAISRRANMARLTFDTLPPGIKTGQSIRVLSTKNPDFSASNAIIGSISGNTVSYFSEGPDIYPAADPGTVISVREDLVRMPALQTPDNAPNPVVQWGNHYRPRFAISGHTVGTVEPGGSVDIPVISEELAETTGAAVIGATATRNLSRNVSLSIPDEVRIRTLIGDLAPGLMLSGLCLKDNHPVARITNITGVAIKQTDDLLCAAEICRS